jgi:SAM-dependent methyltransferase
VTADNNSQLPAAERVYRLLRQLGIERAHFAAGAYSKSDLLALMIAHPEIVASVTLIDAANAEVLRPFADRLLLVGGDSGPIGQQIAALLQDLPEARGVTLPGYAHAAWSDLAADRPGELGAALHGFLADVRPADRPDSLPRRLQDAESAGITFRLRGAGEPLVLLPLGLSRSQWTPLLPSFETQYATLVLGGPVLAPAGLVEWRAASPGFRRVVGALVDSLALRDGERVLDIGCGTGAIARWLARRTGGANPIVAMDISHYMLGEAKALAEKEGLGAMVEFQYGDAENLPFPAAAFDVTLAVTLLEEGNADRMLGELVRVTRPGGRVAAVVRADDDLPRWVNLPVSAALKARVEAPGFLTVGSGKAEDGCADASLYRRFAAAGLIQLQMFPQWYDVEDSGMEAAMRVALPREEAEEWRAAVAQARAEGTFCIARPSHCAVGTRP